MLLNNNGNMNFQVVPFFKEFVNKFNIFDANFKIKISWTGVLIIHPKKKFLRLDVSKGSPKSLPLLKAIDYQITDIIRKAGNFDIRYTYTCIKGSSSSTYAKFSEKLTFREIIYTK